MQLKLIAAQLPMADFSQDKHDLGPVVLSMLNLKRPTYCQVLVYANHIMKYTFIFC